MNVLTLPRRFFPIATRTATRPAKSGADALVPTKARNLPPTAATTELRFGPHGDFAPVGQPPICIATSGTSRCLPPVSAFCAAKAGQIVLAPPPEPKTPLIRLLPTPYGS